MNTNSSLPFTGESLHKKVIGGFGKIKDYIKNENDNTKDLNFISDFFYKFISVEKGIQVLENYNLNSDIKINHISNKDLALYSLVDSINANVDLNISPEITLEGLLFKDKNLNDIIIKYSGNLPNLISQLQVPWEIDIDDEIKKSYIYFDYFISNIPSNKENLTNALSLIGVDKGSSDYNNIVYGNPESQKLFVKGKKFDKDISERGLSNKEKYYLELVEKGNTKKLTEEIRSIIDVFSLDKNIKYEDISEDYNKDIIDLHSQEYKYEEGLKKSSIMTTLGDLIVDDNLKNTLNSDDSFYEFYSKILSYLDSLKSDIIKANLGKELSDSDKRSYGIINNKITYVKGVFNNNLEEINKELLAKKYRRYLRDQNIQSFLDSYFEGKIYDKEEEKDLVKMCKKLGYHGMVRDSDIDEFGKFLKIKQNKVSIDFRSILNIIFPDSYDILENTNYILFYNSGIYCYTNDKEVKFLKADEDYIKFFYFDNIEAYNDQLNISKNSNDYRKKRAEKKIKNFLNRIISKKVDGLDGNKSLYEFKDELDILGIDIPLENLKNFNNVNDLLIQNKIIDTLRTISPIIKNQFNSNFLIKDIGNFSEKELNSKSILFEYKSNFLNLISYSKISDILSGRNDYFSSSAYISSKEIQSIEKFPFIKEYIDKRLLVSVFIKKINSENSNFYEDLKSLIGVYLIEKEKRLLVNRGFNISDELSDKAICLQYFIAVGYKYIHGDLNKQFEKFNNFLADHLFENQLLLEK